MEQAKVEALDPYHDLEEEVEEMEEVEVEAMEEVEVKVMEEVEVEVEVQVEGQGELDLSQILFLFLSWVLLGKQVMQPIDPASAEVNYSEVVVEVQQ